METQYTLSLEPGQLISDRMQHACTLQVLRGRIRLTIEGDRRDYWLSAGKKLELAVNRLTVIEADAHGSLLKIQNKFAIPQWRTSRRPWRLRFPAKSLQILFGSRAAPPA